MLEKLKPDYVSGSVYGIDWEKLYENGVRYALFDMDNTLMPDHATPGPEAYALLEKLDSVGIRPAVVSNGKARRLEAFRKKSGVPCASMAAKPGTDGIRRALRELGANGGKAVLFGDQLFTDVLAANRAWIESCLVAPVSKKEVPQVRIKRPFEKLAIRLFGLLDGAVEL